MRRLNLTAAVDVNDDIGTKCLLPSSTQLLPIKWQIVYFIFFICVWAIISRLRTHNAALPL